MKNPLFVVVDDEEDLREFLIAIIRSRFPEGIVVEAATVVEGKRVLGLFNGEIGNRPIVVVLDQNFPDGNGTQVLEDWDLGHRAFVVRQTGNPTDYKSIISGQNGRMDFALMKASDMNPAWEGIGKYIDEYQDLPQ